MMTFGSYLRELREKRQMTQIELSATSQVTIPYISKLENDKAPPPSEETCISLANALGEDPYVFIVRAGKVPSDFQNVIFTDSEAFQYLSKKARAMNGGIRRD